MTPQQLVTVVQRTVGSASTYGPPLAVGRLAVDLNTLKAGEKGKAVHVLHTWKDHLFAMGNKGDPPGEIAVKEDESKDPTSEPADERQESVPDDVANDPSGANGAAPNALPPAKSLAPASVPKISTSAPSEPAFSKEGEICPLETMPRLTAQQRSPTSYASQSCKLSRPRSSPLHPRLFLYRRAPSTRHTSCLSGLHSFPSPRLVHNRNRYLAKCRLRTHRSTSSIPTTSLSSHFSSFWISNGF